MNILFYNYLYSVFIVVDKFFLYIWLISIVDWLILFVSFIFLFKLALFLILLILIRCGTVRYRYDQLTKLGWLEYIGFVLCCFFCFLFLLLLW